MIKNIVFDIGNVLALFPWRKYIEERGVPEELREEIAKAVFLNPLWNEIDRETIPYEAVIKEFIKAAPHLEKWIRLCTDNVHGLILRADYAIPWIEELKSRGYKVYCLSNFSSKTWQDCEDALDFFPHLDGGIRSFENHFTKPEPEIYKSLFEKYDLIPKECVFLDDLEKNIEAARALGMKGIVFTGYEEGKKQLEEILAGK